MEQLKIVVFLMLNLLKCTKVVVITRADSRIILPNKTD